MIIDHTWIDGKGDMTMRLRKGFGSVKKLSGENRRNQYAVYPPKVNSVLPKAICYVDDRTIGICVLNAWHNGKYYKGMELDLKTRSLDEVEANGSSTFQMVYEQYWEHRFGEAAPKNLKKSSQAAARSAWLRMEPFWTRTMDEVTIMELQEIVNETAKKYSKTTVTRVICLIKGLNRFAVPRELCKKDIRIYVETLRMKEEEHHDAFTDAEIEKLWEAAEPSSVSDQGNTIGVVDGNVDIAATAQMILTMVFSGFRIGAWREMHIDLERGIFIGGVKTEAGKNRTVPIHSKIRMMVEGMNGVFLCGKSESQFRRDMKTVLEKIGIRPLTPHSCRHTFHRLLERAGVGEADRKRPMGHSLKEDITNGVYGHRGAEELRAEIEKINAMAA